MKGLDMKNAVYADTILQCITCAWEGKKEELTRENVMGKARCPGCETPLLSCDMDDDKLIEKNAVALSMSH